MSDPTEQLAVTFFETPVLTVRALDGTIYLLLSDLCVAVGLNLSSQRRRLRGDQDLRDGLQRFRVATAGGIQESDCLMLEFVPVWLSTVSRRHATPVVQERLRYLRLFIIREVYDTITRSAGLPTGTSRSIEDLRDLQQFDAAMQGIAERQKALEESQERARQAWKDHEQRLQMLENQQAQGGPISNAQRGQIYQLVHLWAEARVVREQLSFGAAVAGCWAVVKQRYTLARYEQLPAADYNDCVGFIRRAYVQLTGHMPVGEQLPLPEPNDQT